MNPVSRMLGLQAGRTIPNSYSLLFLPSSPGSSQIFLQYSTASAPQRPFLFSGQHPTFSATFCFLSMTLGKYKLSQTRPEARGRSSRRNHDNQPTESQGPLSNWQPLEQRKMVISHCSKVDSVSQQPWTKRWIG